MFFHVYAFERYSADTRRGRGYMFTNLNEQQLRTRIVDPWDRGEPMTWSGRTADSMRVANIMVFRTETEFEGPEPSVPDLEDAEAENVTNEWILGAAGRLGRAADRAVPAHRDRRRVMVVHGRNLRARDAMFTFLRALGLTPMEWDDAVRETGEGSPHNLEAVRAAMEVGQAVVVLLTAEDRAGLLPDLAESDDDRDDTRLRGQPRQNVILEAGLAMGVDRTQVILVELGEIRRASDFDGLNTVRLTNAAASRVRLKGRLQTAGCEVNETGSDWTWLGAGGDFEAAVIPWADATVE